jgi:hypothetical protein
VFPVSPSAWWTPPHPSIPAPTPHPWPTPAQRFHVPLAASVLVACVMVGGVDGAFRARLPTLRDYEVRTPQHPSKLAPTHTPTLTRAPACPPHPFPSWMQTMALTTLGPHPRVGRRRRVGRRHPTGRVRLQALGRPPVQSPHPPLSPHHPVRRDPVNPPPPPPAHRDRGTARCALFPPPLCSAQDVRRLPRHAERVSKVRQPPSGAG